MSGHPSIIPKFSISSVIVHAATSSLATAAGVDGWTSSSLHKQTEVAPSADALRNLYGQWAPMYETEMLDNKLASYKSVASTLSFHLPHRQTLKVLDAGCGTGLLGAHVIEVARARECTLQVTGTDISPDMLMVAGRKGVYHDLILADLNKGVREALDQSGIGQGKYDYVVASGLFMPGHCGPKAFGVLLKSLKVGGMAVVTVREAAYKKGKDEWRKHLEEAGGKLISDDSCPYYGKIKAAVLAVKRTK